MAGIIANPASGKDIRRLVAHASVFGNDEKVAIVRRVIMGMVEAGVERVLYMPDPYKLIPQAIDGLGVDEHLVPVEGAFHANAHDTVIAAREMAKAGARVVVSLGGDGTNRSLVQGSSEVPLIPVSTGTNNVFPIMIEGTIVGLAAAAVATGAVNPDEVGQRCKKIEISVDGQPRDIALIDAVLLDGVFIGSRAVWDMSLVREALLTRALPAAIGLSSIGGQITTINPDDDAALHVRLARDEDPVKHRFRAAIAPGLVHEIAVAQADRLDLGAIVAVQGPGMFALDGEREFQLKAGENATMTVRRSGPIVVDIEKTLEAARNAGFLRMTPD
ncbi:MAG TPA: NAD(+)/NADH kinase [Dehalococcoidia bacterium]|nr:NAD(+)/NADH kinase [Dehalococcoidia bacterium]